MKKHKVMYSIFFIVLILALITLFNPKAAYAQAEDYTQNYEGGYSVSFSNYKKNSTDNNKLGTVDVKVVFSKKIANNATIPEGWTKVDDNTLSITESQAAYRYFTIDMADGTKGVVFVVTPFNLVKGEKILNVSLATFGLSSEGKTLDIKSSDSNILKVTENSGSFSIEAIGVGSATLTGTITSTSDEFNGGTMSVKGFVDENLDSMNCWNISLNPNKINVKVGETAEIKVNATLKEEYSGYQVSAPKFNVACEIADTAIAKYVAQDGEDTKESAHIQGLKKGSTTMKVTVSSKSGDTFVFKNIPISVSDDSAQEENKIIPEWEITLNKEKLDMKVGDKDEIIVNAQLKEGYSTVQEVEKRFNVTWKLGDTTIAKYTAEDGEEMTSKGKAGSAKIEALKSGNTTMTIIVSLKEDSSKSVSFDVPINVSSTDNKDNVPVTDEKSNNNTDSKTNGTSTENKNDNIKQNGKQNGTVANSQIPSAGSNNVIIFFIIAGIVSAVVAVKKMKK